MAGARDETFLRAAAQARDACRAMQRRCTRMVADCDAMLSLHELMLARCAAIRADDGARRERLASASARLEASRRRMTLHDLRTLGYLGPGEYEAERREPPTG